MNRSHDLVAANMSETASFEIVTPGDGKSREFVLDRLEAQLVEREWSSSEVFGLQMAVEESISNAYRHGNHNGEKGDVEIRWEVSVDDFVIEVKDNGDGFSEDSVPDPTAMENLEKLSGRGLLLMRNYMDAVEYSDGGRVVVMRKKRVVQTSG